MIATTMPTREDLTLTLSEEIHVKASIERTFESLLEMLGPGNETEDGKSLSMKIEAWPGGRWYRDLGKDNGHFWANVQAIKRPTLLEFTGPLFMSAPVMSNVQYRLTSVEGGTIIAFKHTAFGFIPDDFKTHMPEGWSQMHARVRERAESK
jgi:uncharacterized protein YndB with AHSA1/START domain